MPKQTTEQLIFHTAHIIEWTRVPTLLNNFLLMSLGSTPTGAWQPIGILCGVTAPEPMGVGLRVDTSDPAVDPLKSGLADSEVSIRDMFIFFCREKARRGWGQTRRTWKLIRLRKERILKLCQITC